ncbi:MAG: hypothetical protein KAQ87_05570 [Candidatus Pacebacteria bacterium]|nr:hypothetical protein [Candidatus Paceibacterota bacterium]
MDEKYKEEVRKILKREAGKKEDVPSGGKIKPPKEEKAGNGLSSKSRIKPHKN